MSVCQTARNVPISSVDSQENNWNCCQLATRSHILKLQFNAPNLISVGAPLKTPLGHWGSLQRSPDPTWILGVLLLREARGGEEAKRRGGNEKGKGREEGPSPITPLGQASPSRRPGLWVTWPGLRIFWPRNDVAPLLRWRRHWLTIHIGRQQWTGDCCLTILRAICYVLGQKKPRILNNHLDNREISFLFQRLSVLIQRYNAILLHDCFAKEKE